MKKLLHLSLEDSHFEMIQSIEDRLHLGSSTAVIKYALYQTRELVEGPAYARAKEKNYKPELTPMDIEQRKIERSEARKQLLKEKKLGILEELNGTIIDNNENEPIVQWYNYWSKGKDLQQMPLMMLTDDLITNQFSGDKEDIKKYHKLK